MMLEYVLNGKKRMPIAPAVADMFEEMAKRQKMLVERSPTKIVITATAGSTLW